MPQFEQPVKTGTGLPVQQLVNQVPIKGGLSDVLRATDQNDGAAVRFLWR